MGMEYVHGIGDTATNRSFSDLLQTYGYAPKLPPPVILHDDQFISSDETNKIEETAFSAPSVLSLSMQGARDLEQGSNLYQQSKQGTSSIENNEVKYEKELQTSEFQVDEEKDFQTSFSLAKSWITKQDGISDTAILRSNDDQDRSLDNMKDSIDLSNEAEENLYKENGIETESKLLSNQSSDLSIESNNRLKESDKIKEALPTNEPSSFARIDPKVNDVQNPGSEGGGSQKTDDNGKQYKNDGDDKILKHDDDGQSEDFHKWERKKSEYNGPPGLEKTGGIPPGLLKKGGAPPGLAKKEKKHKEHSDNSGKWNRSNVSNNGISNGNGAREISPISRSDYKTQMYEADILKAKAEERSRLADEKRELAGDKIKEKQVIAEERADKAEYAVERKKEGEFLKKKGDDGSEEAKKGKEVLTVLRNEAAYKNKETQEKGWPIKKQLAEISLENRQVKKNKTKMSEFRDKGKGLIVLGEKEKNAANRDRGNGIKAATIFSDDRRAIKNNGGEISSQPDNANIQTEHRVGGELHFKAL